MQAQEFYTFDTVEAIALSGEKTRGILLSYRFSRGKYLGEQYQYTYDTVIVLNKSKKVKNIGSLVNFMECRMVLTEKTIDTIEVWHRWELVNSPAQF
ncbi:MAG TPA: hypothetical protein VNX68_19415 [Nitrosopumilaceae archaeon]|jgi:hypothetical protein|nr:hypothetical protein [Nitrosopumilaceae archaeon]